MHFIKHPFDYLVWSCFVTNVTRSSLHLTDFILKCVGNHNSVKKSFFTFHSLLLMKFLFFIYRNPESSFGTTCSQNQATWHVQRQISQGKRMTCYTKHLALKIVHQLFLLSISCTAVIMEQYDYSQLFLNDSVSQVKIEF